jgi:formylglycine-generating enzyme required for sulfatase activity
LGLGLAAGGATQVPQASGWSLVAGGTAAGALAVFLAARGRGARGGSRPPAGSDSESNSSDGTDVPANHPPEIVNSIGMRLRLISAGTFTQGSPPSEAGRADHEGPQREVTLTRPFYLGVRPVTQAEYLALCQVNPAHFQAGRGGGPEHPVEMVSWDDAAEFCRRLSARPEEQSLGRKYRLPTEAEWEYACRGGTRTAYHGGDSLDSTQANFNGDFPGGQAAAGPNRQCTSPVGTFPPNAWGLEDMHGNVWEWCRDRYAADAYRVNPAVDPEGPPRGEARVMRGGSWVLRGRDCRAAARDKLAPSIRGKQVGFRVVCEVAPGAG